MRIEVIKPFGPSIAKVEIPKNILDNIKIVPVKTVDDVLKEALVSELKPVEWIEVENLPKSSGKEKPVYS